jgi:hypothetical protein
MSELIFNDGNMRARASLRAPDSEISEELRLHNFKLPEGRMNRDGTLDLPSLSDWKEAECAAQLRLAARASQQNQEKQTP